MRLIFSLLLLSTIFASCNKKNKIPDVSGVNVTLSTSRFEEQFFSMDTTKLPEQAEKLAAEYPAFGNLFMVRLLGLTPDLPKDTANAYLKQFISYYGSVYSESEKLFRDFSPYEKKIRKAFQFVKYYFPSYKLPQKIVTFIGPVDGTGHGIGEDELYIGLQDHLGSDFPFYKTPMVEEIYPDYVTRDFTPEYITINSMQVIEDDMYPDNTEDKRLLVQMVEKGKRLYLLSRFLPDEPEHKLIGYTAVQLADCYKHEAAIWDLFIKNNYLQVADNNLIKNYVSPGPKTQELGEDAPGNIGSFAGWQIVKKFMDKNPDMSPADLMKTDAEKIYSESKYKP